MFAHLQTSYIKQATFGLKSQSGAKQQSICEAFARGCGYRNDAALKAAMSQGAYGAIVSFDETAFQERLLELSGISVSVKLPPIVLESHDSRYLAKILKRPSMVIRQLRPASVHFQLSGMTTMVSMISTKHRDGYFHFSRSHAIHAPGQAGPYMPGRSFDADLDYNMHRAIESVVSYYEIAVANGNVPDDGWLIPLPRPAAAPVAR